MSHLLSYLEFACVIVGAAFMVALGTLALRRLSWASAVATVAGLVLIAGIMLRLEAGDLVASNILVLGSSVGGALLLARTVPSSGALVTLAVTASVVDVVSFLTGPTRWLLDAGVGGTHRAVQYLAVCVPYAGSVVPAVGIGDLLLFGVFFLGLERQGTPRWMSLGVLSLGLLVALGFGLWLGGAFGIPFMAVGTVALSLRSFGGTRDVTC
jgi:hypothetical protein